MHACVCISIGIIIIISTLIMQRVYLEASRRAPMWFVDVNGYKLPSPGSVFMEHLWHKDGT